MFDKGQFRSRTTLRILYSHLLPGCKCHLSLQNIVVNHYMLRSKQHMLRCERQSISASSVCPAEKDLLLLPTFIAHMQTTLVYEPLKQSRVLHESECLN